VVSQSNFGDGVDASAAYIVDHNLAPVMSTSYGSCEQTLGPVQSAFYNALWKQAAAEGITSFVSSGDSGGAGCDATGGNYASGVAVNGIASTPYNIAVGGTQLDDTANPSAYWNSVSDATTGLSALGYIPEKAWNESSNDPMGVLLLGGGGGVSTLYAKPNWQVALGVPNDGKRDLPDFSLTAAVHDGYLLCLFGNCGFGQYFYSFGGTSASSPAAAGIMALVNQKMSGQPQGMANYVFYRLAAIPGVYHDITVGDNKVPDASGQYTVGYSTGIGYDLATGLGSFDANALVNNWQAAATAIGSTTTLTLGGGQSLPTVHGAPITFKITVKCSSGAGCAAATGLVTLLATDANGNAFDAGVAQLTAGAPSNVTFSTKTIPGGTYNVTARYSGDGKYYSSTSNAVQVSVTPESSQTRSCASTSRNACMPIGTVSPQASAIGMNCDGGMEPMSGCLQRISASSDAMRPLRRSMIVSGIGVRVALYSG
jgi:subtilase family serine protease